MITSPLFLGLKEDLSLNLSVEKVLSSFLKCHIRQSFLPYSSNVLVNFAWAILLTNGVNSRPLDNREISEPERFLLDKLMTFLRTNFPPDLALVREAVLISWCFSNCLQDSERFSVWWTESLFFSFLVKISGKLVPSR